jgi:hypothetical protein
MVTVGGESLFVKDVVRIGRHLKGNWQIGHDYSSAETGIIAIHVLNSSYLPDAGVVAAGAAMRGPVVINAIVYAELSIGYTRIEDVDRVLADAEFRAHRDSTRGTVSRRQGLSALPRSRW